jgi:hypothetical protein
MAWASGVTTQVQNGLGQPPSAPPTGYRGEGAPRALCAVRRAAKPNPEPPGHKAREADESSSRIEAPIQQSNRAVINASLDSDFRTQYPSSAFDSWT